MTEQTTNPPKFDTTQLRSTADWIRAIIPPPGSLHRDAVLAADYIDAETAEETP